MDTFPLGRVSEEHSRLKRAKADEREIEKKLAHTSSALAAARAAYADAPSERTRASVSKLENERFMLKVRLDAVRDQQHKIEADFIVAAREREQARYRVQLHEQRARRARTCATRSTRHVRAQRRVGRIVRVASKATATGDPDSEPSSRRVSSSGGAS